MSDSDPDLDALLGLTELPTVPTSPAPAPEAQAAEPTAPMPEPATPEPTQAPVDVLGRPLPDAELTPEQLEIRNLRHLLALQTTRALDRDIDEEVVATSDSTIVIHFVGDKVTALGRQWYRGQELEFDVPSEPYQDTKDRNGFSWLDMSDDDQIARWGDIQFRMGPWRGKSYADDAAEKAERKRRRAAPALPKSLTALKA